MTLATSTSTRKSLPIINTECVLRRNVRTQPYGRCSVCTLRLGRCHAWQSSTFHFAVIVLVLATLVVPPGWPVALLVVAALATLVAQGRLNHRRTDELIYGRHRLELAAARLREQNHEIEQARDNLEGRVRERTGELAAANVELARAHVAMLQAAQGRARMIVDLSHELRTPLTSIKGAAQNMLDQIPGPLTPDQREYVDIIRTHSERLIEEARKIIEAARGEQEPVELRRRRVDVVELATEVVRGLAPIAEEREVALTLSADAPIEAQIDPAKMRTVIENLVSNAIKYSDAGGRVELRVEKHGVELEVSVRDAGVGIDPDELPRLFTRFVRAAPDRDGAGVGLALSRELVRLHGGDIRVRSEQGRGSEFTAIVPAELA